VERLTAQGRMTEAGMARVREAKENGEWEAAIRREDISSLPDDLIKALEGRSAAQANFEKYPASQKKMFLHWIASAKTEGAPESASRTREMASQGTRRNKVRELKGDDPWQLECNQLPGKLQLITEHWSPKIIAQMNETHCW
jgi:uncharacterized protein YdeI (YjbR/CyaY-like superfamily)